MSICLKDNYRFIKKSFKFYYYANIKTTLNKIRSLSLLQRIFFVLSTAMAIYLIYQHVYRRIIANTVRVVVQENVLNPELFWIICLYSSLNILSVFNSKINNIHANFIGITNRNVNVYLLFEVFSLTNRVMILGFLSLYYMFIQFNSMLSFFSCFLTLFLYQALIIIIRQVFKTLLISFDTGNRFALPGKILAIAFSVLFLYLYLEKYLYRI